jgi:hypothetical protein
MMAMHGPNGQYKSAHESEVDALKAEGWLDGFEYWSKINAGEEPFPAPIIGYTGLPSAADLDAVEAEKELARPATRKPPKKAR